MTTGRYELDRGEEGQARLRQLAMIDGDSQHFVEARGIEEGWAVLDVGAGGGSMTDWFCRRVGPSGRVVALDLDTQNLERLTHPNLEVRQADLVTHEVERETFDLVFARLVLNHIPEREAVLDRLVAALKRGGWIVLMDGDYAPSGVDTSTPPDVAGRYSWVEAHWPAAAAAAGRTLDSGRRHAARLIARGLEEVGAEGRQALFRGGTERALFWQRTRRAAFDILVRNGEVTHDEVEAAVAAYDDPRLAVWDTSNVYTWGRRPLIN